MSAPRVISQVDPEFSEEARKAKYQGTCTLMLVVDSSGRPTNIRVANSLGMGLDEKAIEAAKKWRFELFYFDYSLGVLIAAVVVALTLGMMGPELSFTDNLSITGKRQMFLALAGVAMTLYLTLT